MFLLLLTLSLLYILLGINQYIQAYSYSEIKDSEHNLSISYSYQIAPSEHFSIDDVLINDNKFTSIENLSASFSRATHWLKYQVKNRFSKNTHFVLHIDNPMLAKLELYEVNDISSLNTLKNSPLMTKPSVTKMTVESDVFPHHKFSLQNGEQKTFFLKTQTFKHPYVPLMLYSEENFLNKKSLNQMIFIVFISTILIMVFYNLVIYRALKDKIYLIYVAYLFNCLLLLGSTNGFGYYIFSPEIQHWLNANSLLFHYGVVLSLLFFTLYFLKYNEYQNKRYKISIWIAGVYSFIAIISYSYDPTLHTRIFFTSMPLFYFLCIVLIIARIKSDFSWGRFYFLSWIPLLTGAAIQPLVLLNILEYSLLTRHAFTFGIIIEILFMTCALADRIRKHEKDRIQNISFHTGSLIPRKVSLETTLAQLISEGKKSTHVLVIRPENIDTITLYIDDNAKALLFKTLYEALSKMVNERHSVISFTNSHEKLCLLENNRFALIIANNKQNDLSDLIKAIQKTIVDHYHIEDFTITLSAEVGVAKYPEHGDSIDSLISHAQVACNHAEQSATKWTFYLHEDSEQNHNFMSLAKDLKKALSNNEFEIYHQPQVDLKTLRVCGSECLIRWKHKTLGHVPPPTFISIAENIGLINQLTLWVVEQSLSQHAQITENEKFNHMVSINISGKDIESANFFVDVTKIIEDSEISPEKIIFEITESSAIINNQRAVEVIEKLTSIGITISIDDFGTGYSSLSYINALPFQELKIDRQFVEGVCDEPKRKVIAENSVKMAKGLGLEVVAEGVNSKLDEDTLRQFGCDIGQGYYYARPMPIDDYIDWLSNQVNAQIPESYYGEFIPADKG